jgi:hypothetical protein
MIRMRNRIGMMRNEGVSYVAFLVLNWRDETGNESSAKGTSDQITQRYL